MKQLKAVAGVLLVTVVIVIGNNRIGIIPPLLRFLSPFQGFWQNSESADGGSSPSIQLREIEEEAKVVFDERGVPHIFASNDHDLYFLQGYLTAKDRLWQMEFQTYAAAGRLSEIVGKKALDFDLEQRRMGMVWAAERALQFMSADSVILASMTAYADGVNFFIAGLTDKDLPVEYKLLDNRPETWTILKSALLLKYLAKMLNGTERDRPNTEALKLLGPDLFAQLFPDQNYLADPVIPHFTIDTTWTTGTGNGQTSMHGSWDMTDIQPSFVGSNNWAITGNRTANGAAILCNDPHLPLSLPSIWYEVQLQAPGINCYGVSLPGAPGITIGFNDSIAWGVTNAGRDVKEYFSMDFIDHSLGTYRMGEKVLQAEKRLERIRIRGSADVVDTVLYTAFGPVAQADRKSNGYLALRWLAHDPSNELRTFYGLNRAKNVADYRSALSHYRSPAQNFAYADTRNNIALWHQGKFKMMGKEQGKFIQDGTDEAFLEERFIPQESNPHMINPERGFVSSANQPPTDTTYPYYYDGVFEEFRNRTINDFLRDHSSVSVQDMMDLQLNNYNRLAAEALPIMLQLLDTNRFQYAENERLALNELIGWDYKNNAELIAPTVFEIWWDELNNILWDEFNAAEWDQNKYYLYSWEQLMKDGTAKIDMRDPRFVYPTAMVTIGLLRDQPTHIMFDHRATNNKREDARDVVYDSFYWTAMKFGDIIKYEYNLPYWGYYKGTHVEHLARLAAFSSKKLPIGGSRNAPNAMTDTHGPSWRMIVEMNADGPKAWGVLAGGQSGNPGSPHYLTSLQQWASGKYHPLNFLKTADEKEESWKMLTARPSSE